AVKPALQSTPSPSRGGIKGGGMEATISGLYPPPPGLPHQGGGADRVCGRDCADEWSNTSPLMGEARWGWGRELNGRHGSSTHHHITVTPPRPLFRMAWRGPLHHLRGDVPHPAHALPR